MKKVIIQLNFPGMSIGKYDKVWEELRSKGYSNPKGMLYHVGGISGNNLVVSDVWESLEAFNKFGEILLPILKLNGFPDLEPTVIPVHYEYNSLSADVTRKLA